MSDCRVNRLLATSMGVACLLESAQAFAIDPFTILAAGSAATSAVQTVAGASSQGAEVGASLDALSELTSELGLGDDSSQDPQKIARKIQAIEALALDLGYTHDEAQDIVGQDRDSSQNLSLTLGKITRSVRLGKHLLLLAGVSTQKAAEISTLDQGFGQNDEKKILSDIYSYLIRKDLSAKEAELKKNKQVVEEIKLLGKFLKSVAPSGNLNLFPVQRSIVKKAIDVFRSYSNLILGLVAMVFVSRILHYQFTFSPPEKYGDLVIDTLSCFFLMMVFPLLYGYMAEYSEALSLKLSQLFHVTGPKFPESPRLFGHVFPWWLQPAVLKTLIYLLVYSIFNLILAVLIALGPIMIFSGTMLGFSGQLSSYFGWLLIIWLWPVVWNVAGFFANSLWDGRDLTAGGIAETALAVVFYAFQLISPLVLLRHLEKSSLGQAVGNTFKRKSTKTTVQTYSTENPATAGGQGL